MARGDIQTTEFDVTGTTPSHHNACWLSWNQNMWLIVFNTEELRYSCVLMGRSFNVGRRVCELLAVSIETLTVRNICNDEIPNLTYSFSS